MLVQKAVNFIIRVEVFVCHLHVFWAVHLWNELWAVGGIHDSEPSLTRYGIESSFIYQSDLAFTYAILNYLRLAALQFLLDVKA